MKYYIWTEIYNCGKIGRIALQSFIKFHPNLKVHVYGYKKDFDYIIPSKNIIPVIVPNKNIFFSLYNLFLNRKKMFKGKIYKQMLEIGFSKGHLGTAQLWSYIIQNRKETYLIHFDSDSIFLGNIIDEMISKSEKYDLIGPIRNYKNNPFNIKYFENFENVTATNCFLFNRKKIDKFSFNTLTQMCLGAYNPLNHKVIDFFDSISFNILKNNGTISFLDPDDVGACNIKGSRDNKYSTINNYNTPFKIDYGNKLIHFSAVGSGMNIYNNKLVNMADSYKQYALDRYALYCKIFYNEDLGVDLSSYQDLINFFEKNVLPELEYRF